MMLLVVELWSLFWLVIEVWNLAIQNWDFDVFPFSIISFFFLPFLLSFVVTISASNKVWKVTIDLEKDRGVKWGKTKEMFIKKNTHRAYHPHIKQAASCCGIQAQYLLHRLAKTQSKVQILKDLMCIVLIQFSFTSFNLFQISTKSHQISRTLKIVTLWQFFCLHQTMLSLTRAALHIIDLEVLLNLMGLQDLMTLQHVRPWKSLYLFRRHVRCQAHLTWFGGGEVRRKGCPWYPPYLQSVK